MGSGFSGVGAVPAEVHNHFDPEREYPDDARLGVTQVWGYDDSGVELTGSFDEHISVEATDIPRLVALLCVAGEVDPAGEAVRQHVAAIRAEIGQTGWPEETGRQHAAPVGGPAPF